MGPVGTAIFLILLFGGSGLGIWLLRRWAAADQHRLVAPQVVESLSETVSVFANESAADKAEREETHHQRLIDGGWFDPEHSRFKPDAEQIVAPDDDQAAVVLADVAANIEFAPDFPRAKTTINALPEAGRCWSEIPEPSIDIDEPSHDVTVHNGSWNEFNPARTLARLKAALTDPIIAAALVKQDPMMAFLLPVPDVEVSPEFIRSRMAWNGKRELEASRPTIDGETVPLPTWHTGLTTSQRLVPVGGRAA